jgi:hypothetical protein
MLLPKSFSAVAAMLLAFGALTSSLSPAAAQGTVGRLGILEDERSVAESAGRHKDLVLKFIEAVDRCDLELFRQAWEEAAKLPADEFADTSGPSSNPFSRISFDRASGEIRRDPAARRRALDNETRGPAAFRGALYYLALFYEFCDEFKAGRYVFNIYLARSAGLRDSDGKPTNPKEAAGLLTEAEAAVKLCNRASYDDVVRRARARAAALRDSATRARSEGNTRAAEGFENDAGSFEALANDLERTRAERFKNCPPPSGAEPSGAPGTAPGTAPGGPAGPAPAGPETPRAPTHRLPPEFGLIDGRYRPQFAVGGTFGNVNVPGFGAGTQFDAVLGRERQIIFSPRNLTFAGGAAEFRAPVSSVFGADVASPFSQMTFYAKLEGYSFWGNENATVPFGGNNVAYTYLFPNPATGTTGVLAGATGQDISIKANGEAIKFRAGAEWQVPLADLQTAYAIISGGLAFDYTDSGFEITQQSLFFSDVSARTKLRVDDFFFAPYIGAGVRFDDGNVFASVGGFVAPGVLYTDAWAKQRNLCGPCPNPGDRNFKLSNSFSNTRFAVQTGIDLKVGVRLSPAVAIEGGFQYVHTSHAAFLRPPTTPSEQPVSLDYGSANRFGGQIGIKYTF